MSSLSGPARIGNAEDMVAARREAIVAKVAPMARDTLEMLPLSGPLNMDGMEVAVQRELRRIGGRLVEGGPARCARQAWRLQRVKFPPRQGPATHRESSLERAEATRSAKRRQSDVRAATQVQRLSLVTNIRGPTGSKVWKATVSGRQGEAAGNPGGV